MGILKAKIVFSQKNSVPHFNHHKKNINFRLQATKITNKSSGNVTPCRLVNHLYLIVLITIYDLMSHLYLIVLLVTI